MRYLMVGIEWLSEWMAARFGTPGMLLFDLTFIVVWTTINTVWLFHADRWDPYPFILLNLIFSGKADIQQILMLIAQNKADKRDRSREERHRAADDDHKKYISDMMRTQETILMGMDQAMQGVQQALERFAQTEAALITTMEAIEKARGNTL